MLRLFDSEIKVMEVLWKNGELTASRICHILKEDIGWKMNTSYTVITKLITKNAIERSEPHFICRALVTKAEVQQAEIQSLISKFFDGSTDLLVSSLLDKELLDTAQIQRLKQLLGEWE